MVIATEALEKRTPRDVVESLLLEYCSAHLHPSRRQRQRHRSLYQESNIFSRSSNFPAGLVYKSKDIIFGVDISFHPNNPVVPYVRIVSPRGNRWREAVDRFAARLIDLIPEAIVVIDNDVYESSLLDPIS